MSKKPLTERMESHKGIPKSWIAEVKKLERTIKEKDEKIDEYGDIIDVLATQREGLRDALEHIHDGDPMPKTVAGKALEVEGE